MRIFIYFFLVFISYVKCLELESFYKYLDTDNNTSSSACDLQKSVFLQALFKQDSWALKMLDAFGRIPQAITQGNTQDMGTFDQCVNIHEELDSGNIKGRYCYSGLVIPIITTENEQSVNPDEVVRQHMSRISEPNIRDSYNSTTSISTLLLLATCLPDACYPSDFFGSLGANVACKTKNEGREMNAGDIAFLTFFGGITVLMVASTAYDLYLQKHEKDAMHEILIAFSVYSNGKKILKVSKHDGQIPFFNGLRVISMFWVIMGHRYSAYEDLVVNLEDAKDWRREWYAVYVLLAPLAVDTFLFVSGVLMSYIFLKTMRKPKRPKFNIFLYYLHRYLRLTPALAALYFAQITIVKKITTGPINDPLFEQNVNPPCIDNWWSMFLYIQNYVATDNMCLLHTWYLSLDMQLFIISPLILLPMVYFGRKVTYVGIPILVLITVLYNMLLFYFKDIRMWSDDYYNLYYYVTHTRTTPWLIGIIFGSFILEYQADKQKYQIKSKLLVLAIWGVTIAITGFLFFSQDDVDNNHTTLKSTFYFPLQKPLWALFLCWISYTCMSGNAGFVNSLLSASIFQVLAKITYSTYLVHIPLLFIQLGGIRTLPYFTDYEVFRDVLADICVAYVVGAFWTLAFESPILIIEKVIFGKREKHQKKVDGNNGNETESSGIDGSYARKNSV